MTPDDAMTELVAESERLGMYEQPKRNKELAGIVLQSNDNECTAYPYWYIARKGSFGRNVLLAGIWFSREAAELHLRAKRYNYPKSAFVYCNSGHESNDMKQLYELARKEVGE